MREPSFSPWGEILSDDFLHLEMYLGADFLPCRVTSA